MWRCFTKAMVHSIVVRKTETVVREKAPPKHTYHNGGHDEGDVDKEGTDFCESRRVAFKTTAISKDCEQIRCLFSCKSGERAYESMDPSRCQT